MLRLFIANREVELDDSVEFSINKYFEDTTNPTSIYSDFSKTVTIPRTLNNNKLFGSIYNPDKLITGGESGIGIDFDPYKKIDFILYNDDNILFTGYLKMLSVDNKGYNITLNGELGKVFGELQKITFDTSSENKDYIIDGSQYYSTEINRGIVWDSWNNTKTNNILKKVNDRGYIPYNIIGYTPLNIRTSTDILNQQYYESNNKQFAFTDVLNNLSNPSFEDYNSVDADTVIGDGLKPRDIGEWRSYLQQPFIYFNQLFQIFIEKAKEVTDYTYILDEEWFNDTNPYWNDVVMTLKNFNLTDKDDNKLYYTFTQNTQYSWSTEGDYTTSVSLPLTIKDNTSIPVTDEQSIISVSFALKFWNLSLRDLATDNAIIISTIIGSENRIFVVHNPNCTILSELQSKYPSAIFISDYSVTTDNSGAYTINIPITARVIKTKGNYTLSVAFSAYNNTHPFQYNEMPLATIVQLVNGVATTYSYPKRSYINTTLTDYWDNEYNIFDIIINYCKLFRIGVFVKDKTITFQSYSKYFQQYSIVDWNDKVDYSKDFTVEPMTFENKYVLFNYEDNDSKINTQYKKQYNINIGEYKLLTSYAFNNDTENLFSNNKCPLEATDSVLNWNDLYQRRLIRYIIPKESYISPKDDNDELIENFGTLYMDEGIAEFDTSSNLTTNIISDDTLLQTNIDTYFYSQQSDSTIATTTYHKIGLALGHYAISYTIPKTNFTTNDYSSAYGIYDNEWGAYINERYNVQNKKVTCYIRLSLNDYINFDFNHFITIGNQLYFVNKIFDYNPNNPLTKVELITIHNIYGYTL